MSDEQLIPTPSVFGETGNLLLERELGSGGMGGVYMGRDKMLDRPVAVKVMLKEYGDDAEFVEKFKKEAQAAARLIHPNIAQIYTYGISNGMPYIAMELVAGGSLDQLMQHSGAAIDITRVMKIGEQVAQALRCAADQGLVHGDVKPENILLDSNGNAKLVDFGLAAMQKNTNEIWGTPYYIAPEKVKKEAVDFRADIYSLGGTLYHALTGVAPFEGDDAAAVVRKRFEGAPVPPSKVRAGISPQIDALILKMLALDPAERFPSFEALLEEFKSIMVYGLTPGGTARMPTGSLPNMHKLGVKGRKRFKMKNAASEEEEVEDISEFPEEGEEDSTDEAKPAKGKRRATIPPKSKAKGGEDGAEEESGSVAGKVFGVIGITFGAIALVAGALIWYVIADRNAREAEKQAQIAKQFELARMSIADTRKNAVKFAEEIDEMARKAVLDCDRTTEKLRKELSGKVDASKLGSIKPPPSAELLAAIALTNDNAKADGGAAPAAEGAAAAPAKAAKAASAAAPAAMQMPQFKFRPPNDDEADTASPEHEKYEKEKAAAKAKFEEEWKAKIAAAKQKADEEASAAAAAAAAPASTASDGGSASAFEAAIAEALSSAVRDMNGLWDRAYSCKAASIRIHKALGDLVSKIDSFNAGGDDEEAMRRAADFSNIAKGDFDSIKASEDVSKVQKAGNFIRSRGANAVDQTIKRLLVAVKEEERRQEAERRRIAEIERQKKLAEDKAKTIEADNQKAKDKFNSLVEAGTFRQLNWAGATRQLQALHDEFKYSESQLLARILMKKVAMMATVQEVFIANCKDYKFMRSKLAGHTIAEINEKDGLKLIKPDGKTPMKMTWVKFYQQYHGNLNELIVRFIEHGKDSSKLKDGKRLSLQPWADAMMGAALTMQIICGDDPTAAGRAEQIAKAAVKGLPDYLKHAQEIFPDFTFEASED